MMIEGYTLDIYCDGRSNRPWRDDRGDRHKNGEAFTGRNKTECYDRARAAGWRIGSKYQYCPECVKAGLKNGQKVAYYAEEDL